MKNIYIVILLFLSTCAPEENSAFDLVISNVNLIDGTGSGLQKNVNIGIKGNRIVAIDAKELVQKAKVIDGSGKFLIPGLFDCHVHTGSYKKDFPKFIHFGVTSIFITGGGICTNSYYKEMRDMGNQDTLPAPKVFHTSQHFTMEGRHPVKTYGSSRWREGKTVFFLRDTLQIEELVKEVAQHPIQGIKLTIEDGPHPPLVERMPQEFINKVQKEADKNGLAVFVHVSDNVELQMAIDANIRNIVHFTGVDLDFQRDDALVNKIYRDSISWVTTLMLDKSFLYPLHPEWIKEQKIQEVYDKSYLMGMEDPGFIFRAKDYVDFMSDYLKTENIELIDVITFQVEDIQELFKNGVNMVLGTDTGNTFVLPGYSLHEEMQLLEMGGMEPLSIIKMGTLNAATMMKAADSLGSIETGKIANMVLLDKNPLETIKNTLEINAVIKNGVVQQRIVD
ncbi:amidohydrolase family protein [Ulvibacterium marinum]|uniref:amidohydrolase family protein n=1 Tax=Ulvibacterium marinum TaxID=2419782 RepID=UPI002493DBDE|nr:amidohydrolase family protein [Ulvibacterium marinum]